METSIAVALITGITGVIIAMVTGYFTFRTSARVDELQDKVRDLERENCTQKKVLRNLRGYVRVCLEGIEKLIGQITALGHTPAWRPTPPPVEADEDYE